MRRIDVLFLFSVLAAAAAFAARTISETVRVSGWEAGGEAPAAGTAGQPRDVDLEKIRRLIGEGHLSNHEALFYAKRGEGGRRLFLDPGEIVRVRVGEEFELGPVGGVRPKTPLPEGVVLVSAGETWVLKAVKAGEVKVVFEETVFTVVASP
jgi:hypothetical protein